MAEGVVVASSEQLQAAGALFKALANPTRLGIIRRLAQGACRVHDLVDELRVSQPLVSQHLTVLRGARLVAAQRRGKEVHYSLQDEHVRHIADDAIRHTAERERKSGSSAA